MFTKLSTKSFKRSVVASRIFSTASATLPATFNERWESINKEILVGGGQARIDKQHA